MPIVYPSGGDVATIWWAIVPVAPVRLSGTTGWPRPV